MPSNYTPNYSLSQWEAGDRVLRADFNADNAKIDAALKSLRDLVGTPMRFASGTYTGTGAGSKSITAGFKPKLFLVVRMDGYEQKLLFFTSGFEFLDENGQIGRMVSGLTARAESTGMYLAGSNSTWTDWQCAVAACNVSGVKYAWFAIG